MKTFSFLGVMAVAALAVSPFQSAEAGGRNCNCCGTVTYAAPAAASPAATAAAPAVAQNQNSGYRSFSYQPGTAPVTYNNYYRAPNRRSNQPMWMDGGAKSMGRYH